MKMPASLIAALLALQIPLSFSAPIAAPDGCASTSVNGQTTTTGDCGPNQNAQSSSSIGNAPSGDVPSGDAPSGGTSSAGPPTDDASAPAIAGGESVGSTFSEILDKIKSEIPSFHEGSGN